MSLDATRPVKKYKTMKETGRLLRNRIEYWEYAGR